MVNLLQKIFSHIKGASQQEVILFAPAKINLFLHILGQNPNGYHQLQTLFQKISWFDQLHFKLIEDNHIDLITNFNEATEKNLIYKAAALLKSRYQVKQGIQITLHKNLPTGAGLGGGSSDAGTTLKALNSLWQLNLPISELLELGKELGADVPFFVLDENCCWGEGIGEVLTPFQLPQQWYVILYPNCHSDTKVLYTHPHLPRNTPPINANQYSFCQTHNDFEALACQLYPEIEAAKAWLEQFGPARLTGSGSSLFLPIQNESEGHKIISQAPKDWLMKVCRSL